MAEWIGTDGITSVSTITVDDIIDSVKYDLKDYGAKEFDVTQMLHYLKRVIKILDRVLISFQSDQTLTETDVILSSGDNSVTVPTDYTINIREIWNSDNTQLIKMSHMDLYERRMHRSGDTGEPIYWSHVQNKIEFEIEADDDYTFTVYHDDESALVAIGGNMPYNGVYNEYCREALCMMAKAKKNNKMDQTDAVYLNLFRDIVFQDIINRDFVPKARLDF